MLGHWNERSVGLLPQGDVVLAGRPYRAYSIMKGGKMVGSMRRAGNAQGWFVKIVGFKFETIPGHGAARFGLKETEVKFFETAPDARTAIKAAFKMIGVKVSG
jgi:hypothetical protein